MHFSFLIAVRDFSNSNVSASLSSRGVIDKMLTFLLSTADASKPSCRRCWNVESQLIEVPTVSIDPSIKITLIHNSNPKPNPSLWGMVRFYLPNLIIFTSIFRIFGLRRQKQRRTSGFENSGWTGTARITSGFYTAAVDLLAIDIVSVYPSNIIAPS